jgi:DNA-binding GntR family transcriptional regulator
MTPPTAASALCAVPLDASLSEHLAMLDATLRPDEDPAENVARRHIGHVRGIWAASPG